MKQIYFSVLIILLVCSASTLRAQTFWTGATTTFTKEAGADWTQAANQDRITENVWITRANNRGLFNIATETAAVGMGRETTSPADTEWAFGTISNGIEGLTFQPWGAFHGGSPRGIINRDVILHLITDDIYIDHKLLTFTGRGGNGGFSYERSTDQTLSNDQIKVEKLKLFPNPANNFIQISGLKDPVNYSIYNLLGSEVRKGTVSQNQRIDIQNITSGLYFIRLQNGTSIRFAKQ